MKIGFTGTRKGMSDTQRSLLEEALRWLMDITDAAAGEWAVSKVPEFHHGAAAGADTEAAGLARRVGYQGVRYPATKGQELARNREIVAVIDVLIAAPLQDREIRRSGTWATIRYMLAARKPVIMLPRGNG